MANPDHFKGVKPENFSGTYFKRWANQMKYWLTTLGLISTINDTILAPSPKPSSVGSSPVETPHTSPSSYIYLKPEEIDYHCLHRIISALSDNLYGIYYEYKSAKELWTALEDEYDLDDAGIERFTSSFNKFMMINKNPSINNS